jgi:hypothetical protein
LSSNAAFTPAVFTVNFFFVNGYLTSMVIGAADARTRRRGESYFAAGAVRKLSGDTWSVEAQVQGSRLYEVDIFRFKDDLENSCTCPLFSDSAKICKHIWAVILAAEKAGYLTGDDDDEVAAADVDLDGIHSRTRVAPENGQERKPADWRRQLERLNVAAFSSGAVNRDERQLLYLFEASETRERQRLVLRLAQRERRRNSGWGKVKQYRVRTNEVASLPDKDDRRILTLLLGASSSYGYRYASYEPAAAEFILERDARDVLLPILCATGRCFLQNASGSELHVPLQWDPGDPWEFRLRASFDQEKKALSITGAFRRDDAEIALSSPDLLVAGGLIFCDGRVARLNDHGAFQWIALLRERKSMTVPRRDSGDFVGQYLKLWQRPPLELPEELAFREVSPRPLPLLSIKKGSAHLWAPFRLSAEVTFDYDGERVRYDAPERGVFCVQTRTFVQRDQVTEHALIARLEQLGFRAVDGYRLDSGGFKLHPDLLPRVVATLSAEGWRVEAQGRFFRIAGPLRLELKSGVDWFELSGGADFGDVAIPLPRLLAALKKGEQTVTLGDGNVGILPADWLQKYGMLADFGRVEQNQLRFARHQAALLDALIAAEPQIKADEVFQRLRGELQHFTGVAASDPPAGFTGQLRNYQREGLGWMHFLQRFGFGGCLADDMGLGKTVQALALLQARRTSRPQAAADVNNHTSRPSLVVVPRSLVFHWKREAERFVPALRILDHTGSARRKPGAHFNEYDVVLTTYGTLRLDALHFKDQRFDYCILDEAQAIKNSATVSAKAVRLIRADHRLAMSGTPVENHLGELWSLFEFLNPGILGSGAAFGRARRNADEASRRLLSRALRPFILRRTKEQVARELPLKTEQTLYCDLDGHERKLYNELREFYRARLLKNTDLQETGRIKFQALEALLRLRQAACHPGLIDKSKTAEPSAKIDTLMAQLDQVLEEGHKALVFSQFTSFLAILRGRLDANETRYGYLDGRTRDRAARVDEFQNDPNLKLFLISLKAGGLGLNLQAADYIYLLDPWWNPAVEAQAIDRAHRIGQTRQVFAYRLIARETVEEKVLELQRNKRDLAEAIISGNNSFMQDLTREDLELLLS